MSIMAEMTFMPGFQGISNSSQWAAASGPAWRLILSWTVFEVGWGMLFGHVVSAGTRFDDASVDCFPLEAWLICIRREVGFGGLQEIGIVALRELWFVMRPARFVSSCRALRDHARELQH